VADDAEDVGLAAFGVDGSAHRIAVNGQPLVGRGILQIPALQGAIQDIRVHPGLGHDQKPAVVRNRAQFHVETDNLG